MFVLDCICLPLAATKALLYELLGKLTNCAQFLQFVRLPRIKPQWRSELQLKALTNKSPGTGLAVCSPVQ